MPADAPGAPASPYDRIGGAERIRALVDRFYDLMDADPAYAGIRSLHPASLDGSREKLSMFLSGWLGGPPLYIERFGHPRLRARHLPFPIGASERDQWIACMARALDGAALDSDLRAHLDGAFFRTADHMRNADTSGAGRESPTGPGSGGDVGP